MRRSEFDVCLCVLVCFGLRWGMLLPMLVLSFLRVCKTVHFSWKIHVHFMNKKTLVQLGSVFPHASAVYLVIGFLFLSATVRVLRCFVRFGMCWASVGHVTPHACAEFSAFLCKDRAFF